jgi:uncharacterized protein YndB with AHSA1/START domain
MTPKPPTPRIADEAVREKTGKTWSEWFAALDAAGAAEMSHKQIVAHIAANHDIGAWWQQSITVAYEQARGLREKHEKPGGYEVSGSKTIGVPVAELFASWHDAERRERWLPGQPLVVRKATEPKSLRITWPDGSHLDVNLYAKGEAKSQVGLTHGKLPDAEQAERMKAFWAEALGRLKAELER